MVFSNRNDEIVSLATPQGYGALAVVRASGQGIWDKALRCFRPAFAPQLFAQTVQPRYCYYGHWYDPLQHDVLLDEVQVVFYAAPATFSGENMVEVFCHGGAAAPAAIVRSFLQQGVRQAQPGEFSFRAYFHGKIDLLKAQAIHDVIQTRSQQALRHIAPNLMRGLSGELEAIREQMVAVMARVDVQIDYPDESFEGVEQQQVVGQIRELRQRIARILEHAENGIGWNKGLDVVIVGAPNVGKSTLFNYFLQQERAIVSEIPGTTRDFLREEISLRGIPINLMDTAGIRETSDPLEQMGVGKTLQMARKAHVLIFLAEAAKGLGEKEREFLQTFATKPRILAVNKVDEGPAPAPYASFLPISARTGIGLAQLEEQLADLLRKILPEDEPSWITSESQKNALESTGALLDQALKTLDTGFPLDVAAEDVKQGLQLLDTLTGRDFREDVVSRVFSDFCVGK